MKIEQLSVLATVVIAFAALAALALNGQAGVREDLRALRGDMLRGQTELRREIQAVEVELRAGQTEIRRDLKSLEVRFAVVEQHSHPLPADTGTSTVDPSPPGRLDGSAGEPRSSPVHADTSDADGRAVGGPSR